MDSCQTTHDEERILLRLAEVPPLLIEAVHAAIETSLSLQLVNNLYLTEERTFKRQFDNAIMALLLKWHYSKEQILEASSAMPLYIIRGDMSLAKKSFFITILGRLDTRKNLIIKNPFFSARPR